MKFLLLCLLTCTLALQASELSGKWSGSFEVTNSDGDTKADTAFMDLKEAAGVVTGTAGPNSEQQWPVEKGKLDGQKLTFQVPMEDGGIVVFELTFDGTSIKGSAAGTGPNGEKMSARLDLKRAS